MRRSLILAGVLASFVSLNCPAQASQSGSDSGSGKPTPQSQPPAPAAPQPAPAAKDPNARKGEAKEKRKPKKVWTEEEISAVGGSISVVGDQHPSSSSSPAAALPAASDGRDAAYYRGRLAPLRQQIEDLDREIQQMKNSKGSVRENVDSQVQLRQSQQQKIQKQMGEIEEDARRHGIRPGDLR